MFPAAKTYFSFFSDILIRWFLLCTILIRWFVVPYLQISEFDFYAMAVLLCMPSFVGCHLLSLCIPNFDLRTMCCRVLGSLLVSQTSAYPSWYSNFYYHWQPIEPISVPILHAPLASIFLQTLSRIRKSLGIWKTPISVIHKQLGISPKITGARVDTFFGELVRQTKLLCNQLFIFWPLQPTIFFNVFLSNSSWLKMISFWCRFCFCFKSLTCWLVPILWKSCLMLNVLRALLCFSNIAILTRSSWPHTSLPFMSCVALIASSLTPNLIMPICCSSSWLTF